MLKLSLNRKHVGAEINNTGIIEYPDYSLANLQEYHIWALRDTKRHIWTSRDTKLNIT